MGKSKKRNFSKSMSNKGSVLKRSDVIDSILTDLKHNKVTDESKRYINLFCIKSEELTESGATIEELTLFKHLFY